MKRVSLQAPESKRSGFFLHREAEINEALADDASPTFEFLKANYVSDRGSSATPADIEIMLLRLPAELGVIYRQTVEARQDLRTVEALEIDHCELDFIDFLLTAKKNRVMRLVGPVGTGKTTFLNYIFHFLRVQTQSLRHLMPIDIRFTSYPKKALDENELSEMMWWSIREALQKEKSIPNTAKRRKNLNNILRRVLQRGDQQVRAGGLYALLRLVGEAFTTSDIEPVFIFDNLDQLECSSIELVSHFARALFLETRHCAVLALRPPAYTTHAETDIHKGAFYTFRIELPPPNLRSVFTRRLKGIIRKDTFRFEVEGTQLTFLVDDVATAVKNVIDNVFDRKAERLLIDGIGNRNVRKAARAFIMFLRWPGLRADLLIAKQTREVRRALPGGFYEHLLTGVMLGESPYFIDDEYRRPVITNIFCFRCSEFPVDYMIQYRILALLNWASKVVRVGTVVDWMVALGYNRRHVSLCIEHLLRRGLMYSAESEEEFSKVKNLSGSPAGTFYLDEMVTNDQYLFQVIPDVTLRHDYLSATDRNQFVARMRSIFELVERVEAEERHQFEILVKGNSRYKPQLLGAQESVGLLQQKLLAALERLTNSAFRSEHESVRDMASDFDQKLRDLKYRAESAERKLRQYLLSANWISRSPNVPNEVFRHRWGDRYRLELRAPSELSPGGQNIVEIECEIGKGEEAESLFGRIEDKVGDVLGVGFDEITELHRQGSSNTFEGKFALPWSRETGPLPQMRLSLFADSRPLLRQTFAA